MSSLNFNEYQKQWVEEQLKIQREIGFKEGISMRDKNTPMQETKQKEIREKFAEIEHIRWAKWQNYLHSFLVWNNEIQMWTLPHEKKEHWQEQIRTPYSMLSEKEKESDREQVKPYLSMFSTLLAERDAENEEKTIEFFNGINAEGTFLIRQEVIEAYKKFIKLDGK